MWVSHPPGWPYWKVPPGYLTLFFNTSRHILRFILSTLIFYVQICQRLKNSEKHGTASKFYFFNILGLPCRRMRPRNNFKIFLLLIYVCSHRIIKKIPSFDIKDEQLINIIIGFLFTHFFSQSIREWGRTLSNHHFIWHLLHDFSLTCTKGCYYCRLYAMDRQKKY